MKQNSKWGKVYLGVIFFLMYLPIVMVVIFSFNESKLPVRFTGFSLKWYQELFADDALIEALGNSLILGVSSCLVSAVIGTLGAVGLSRIHWKSKGALEYLSILPLIVNSIFTFISDLLIVFSHLLSYNVTGCNKQNALNKKIYIFFYDKELHNYESKRAIHTWHRHRFYHR